MTTTTLLIIFRDGTEKSISGVLKYGKTENTGTYYFDKNGYRSFLEPDEIRYFGRKFDYAE